MSGDSTPVLPVEQTIVLTEEQKVINNFISFVDKQEENSELPKKSIHHLKDLAKIVTEMNFNDLSLDDQARIRRMMEKEVPHMFEVYISLPKAHAVSVKLENGKTSKENLVDNIHELYNKYHTLWTQAVEIKTKQLMAKNNAHQKTERKIDFFDL